MNKYCKRKYETIESEKILGGIYMKHKHKKMVAALMSFTILCQTFTVPVLANDSAGLVCENYIECNTGGTCYEVIEQNVPVRSNPSKKGETIAHLSTGNLVRVTDIISNEKGKKWAVLEYTLADGHTEEKAYIFTGNLLEHTDHKYVPMITTDTGNLIVCTICGDASVKYSDGNQTETAKCDLACVANQAIRGDFAEEDLSFWGLVARILVGEIPYFGAGADIRDLIYDLLHEPNIITVGIDLAALAPVIGSMRLLAKMDDIKVVNKIDGFKYYDETFETLKVLPWEQWDDYEKVIVNGKEYAKIGDKFLYTEHMVNEFIPSGFQKHTYRKFGSDTSRGLSPTYINDILTTGLKDGRTVKVTPGDPRFSSLIDRGIIQKSFKYDVYCNGSVDVLVDQNNIIVTAITTNRSSAQSAEILKAAQK